MSSEMPEGWTSLPLSHVAKIAMGETLLSKNLTGTGVPVFSANTDDGPWGYTDQNKKTLKRGAIVVGARGSIGFPRLPPFDAFTSTQTTITVEPDDSSVDSGYLHAVLCAADIKSIAAQQAIPMLTIGMLAPLPITLPPLDEQRKIAEVLRSVDEAIAANEEQRKQSDAILSVYRSTVLSHLVVDPVGDARFGDICAIGRGFAFKSDDYVEEGILNFRVTNVGRHPSRMGEIKFLPFDFAEKFSDYILEGDEIVLVMVGATVGKLGRVPSDLCPALLNQNMWTLVGKGDISKELLWHLSHVLIAEKIASIQGGAYSFLTKKDFLNHRIGDIGDPALSIHAEAMSTIERHSSSLRAEAAMLATIKRHLTDDLLSGRVRVPA